MSEFTPKPISYYHLFVKPVLPLVYDEALSYLETLGQVVVKLNEVISWANDYTNQLYAYVDEKAQENLNELLAQLNAYKAQIESQLNGYDGRLTNVENQLNSQLTTINSIIAQFQQQINTQLAGFQLQYQSDINQFKAETTQQLQEQNAQVQASILANTAYVNAQISTLTSLINLKSNENKQYTDTEIQKLKDSIPNLTDVNVIYPGNSLLVSIQEAINLLYHDLSFFTLTSEEYDTLELTAQTYDTWVKGNSDSSLSAQDYDLYGKYYLMTWSSGGGGTSGIYFTPTVSDEGIISWRNNGNLSNPNPVNIKGPQGSPGTDGKSAYEIAVENGYSGTVTEWLASLKGEPGDSIVPTPETKERNQYLCTPNGTGSPVWKSILPVEHRNSPSYFLGSTSPTNPTLSITQGILPSSTGLTGQVYTKTSSGAEWADLPGGDSVVPKPPDNLTTTQILYAYPGPQIGDVQEPPTVQWDIMRPNFVWSVAPQKIGKWIDGRDRYKQVLVYEPESPQEITVPANNIKLLNTINALHPIYETIINGLIIVENGYNIPITGGFYNNLIFASYAGSSSVSVLAQNFSNATGILFNYTKIKIEVEYCLTEN